MLRLLVANAHLPAATGAGPAVHVYARFRGTAGDTGDKGTLRWLSLRCGLASATLVSSSPDGVALGDLMGWGAVGCPHGMGWWWLHVGMAHGDSATHTRVPNPACCFLSLQGSPGAPGWCRQSAAPHGTR